MVFKDYNVQRTDEEGLDEEGSDEVESKEERPGIGCGHSFIWS